MGREIQECILYYVNAHREWNRVHNRGHENLKPLILHDADSYNAQKDAQYVLEEMLKCEFWVEGVAEKKFEEVIHKNTLGGDYCCELTIPASTISLNSQIELMIWKFLGSTKGHRQALLDEYHEHTHAGVEIAHDKYNNITIMTVRLSKI